MSFLGTYITDCVMKVKKTDFYETHLFAIARPIRMVDQDWLILSVASHQETELAFNLISSLS